MDPNYAEWLREAVPSDATMRTKLSELRRVESAYGDLDTLYDDDELSSLLEELTYSAQDARMGLPNPSKLKIEGDIRNNLASYKSAVMKYQRFRQDVESAAARPAVERIDAAREAAARTLSLDVDLQNALRENLLQLEDGMTVADGGSERKVGSGWIDILARDLAGNFVVIDLKTEPARRDALGHVAAYMADIEDELGVRPRAILIAPDFDQNLISAARMVEGLQLVRYGLSFTFSPL